MNTGLIYLAAPIESGMEKGLYFKRLISSKLTDPPIPGLVLFDPHRPYVYDDIETAGPITKRVNRMVIQHSNMVVALLDGCETWREIEFAVSLPVPVWGVWPEYAYHRSPVAELGITVFKNIFELADAIRQNFLAAG